MILSQEIEKKVLSGLIQHQDAWHEVAPILIDEDFYSEDSRVHLTIFRLVKNALNAGEEIDDTILISRIKQLGASFPDSIDIAQYIHSLAFFKITRKVFITAVKDLKKISIRRKLYLTAKDVAQYVKKVSPDKSYGEIIDEVDSLYNNSVREFEYSGRDVINLSELMVEVVEERGNNPIEEFGFMGPHPKLNDIYGSILRAGNISVFCARSGAGKTSFVLDFTTKVASKYNVPVLHFDNGEMSEEELAFRQTAALSGIPMYLLETGQWRTSGYKNLEPEQVISKVRNVWPKVKNLKFYYENVAGMSVEEMTSLLKRFYYSKVGRGNPLIFSFDYIKTDFGKLGQGGEWAFVAKMVHDFKQTIHRELSFDGEKCVSMITSVQSNRLGIVNNRNAQNIIEDESVVGLSDAITQFCSHLFLLRRKTVDEIMTETDAFGTHKLIALKTRHLGKDIMGALEPVELPDGSKRNNYINFEIKNFNVTEKGDLRDFVHAANGGGIRLNDAPLPRPNED